MTPRLPKGFTNPVAIGEGAFASVVRARQAALDRLVAIKIVSEPDRAKRTKLLNEAKTQANLDIPCIPQVYDAFEWRGQALIVMQWIKAAHLADLIKLPLSDLKQLWIANGLIRALAELHSRGYAHRDLKPGNILVSPEHGIFLVDFGFTKHVVSGEKSVAGVVKGTPAYMAPELWQGSPNIDHMRADLYALGRILQNLFGDNAAAYSTVRMLLQEDPAYRAGSAAEFLQVWESQTPAIRLAPDWSDVASGVCAATLSRQLYSSTRELLRTGREGEAYWLLVECIKENPNMPEALALMGQFSLLAKGKKRRKRMRAVALSCAAGATVILISVLMWPRDTGNALAILPGPDIKGVSLLGGKQRELPEGMQHAVFREDDLPMQKLQGNLFVADRPAAGMLRIDNVRCESPPLRETPKQVSFGLHVLSWRNESGKTIWRERVTVLPFQTKGISINPR